MNSNNSNDNIQKILDAADIVQIISEYVPLEKKGNDFKGLCPFHNDSNPSLSVSPSKKVFKCFSCNTAGNVIQFVQKIENISFVEAMKKVASKSGITLNLKENPNEVRNRKYYEIMDKVSQAYEFYLKNTTEGEKALAYLNKRNINDDVIKRFRIGLSSHETNLICKSLVETNQVLPIDLQEVNIIGQNKSDNHYYDLFRGRIMFPLKDLNGHIVGFSGRIYDMESNAKYMNSPENIIFKKSNILYNYSEAFNDIKLKNHVIIFEGFMDVIAAYKAGVNNTLATMGTALTEEQIKIILKLTNNITLCYDGDGPGIEASKRAIKLFAKYGVTVKNVMLPDGLDPDDYLNKYGNEATYDLLVNKNVSCVDYLYNIEKKKLDLNNPVSITNFEKGVNDLINYFKSAALKNYLFKLMSKDLGVEIADIQNDFDNLAKVPNQNKPKVEYKEDIYDIPPIESGYPSDDIPIYDEIPLDNFDEIPENIDDIYIKDIKPASVKNYNKERFENAEKKLIRLSYYDRETCQLIEKKLGRDNFVDKINRNILYQLYEHYNLHETMNKEEFFKKLGPLELDRINSIINTADVFKKECIDDYIGIVKLAKYEKAASDIKEQFSTGNGNEESLERYAECKKKTMKIITKKGK